MRIKYFYPNENDKIEFTREELEKLINDVYDEGREDGMKLNNPTYIPYTPSPLVTPYTPTWYNSPTTTPKYDTTIWCSSDDAAGRCVLEREKYTGD